MKKKSWYTVVRVDDIVKIVPEGCKLAMLRIPFLGSLRITWWLDADGRIGRTGTK